MFPCARALRREPGDRAGTPAPARWLHPPPPGPATRGDVGVHGASLVHAFQPIVGGVTAARQGLEPRRRGQVCKHVLDPIPGVLLPHQEGSRSPMLVASTKRARFWKTREKACCTSTEGRKISWSRQPGGTWPGPPPGPVPGGARSEPAVRRHCRSTPPAPYPRNDGCPAPSAAAATPRRAGGRTIPRNRCPRCRCPVPGSWWQSRARWRRPGSAAPRARARDAPGWRGARRRPVRTGDGCGRPRPGSRRRPGCWVNTSTLRTSPREARARSTR